MIIINPTAFAKLQDFYINSPLATLITEFANIEKEIQSSIMSRKYGVITDTPMLDIWEKKGYKQLYCKVSGWFLGFTISGRDFYIEDAYHQSNVGDYGNTNFNRKQDLTSLSTPTWTYVREANYGFGIVKNSSGQFNYSDLNGDLLIKDKSGNPIWFDNVSPFSEGFLDRLSAYGIKDGKIVFFYSDGHYILTNTPASKYGFTNTSVLKEGLVHPTERRKNTVYLKESQLRSIIREAIRRIPLTA